MTWFAFAGSGSVYNLNGVAEKELVALGAHGYATQAAAVAHPNANETAAQAALLATFQVSASLPVGGGLSGVQAGTSTAVSPTSALQWLQGMFTRGNAIRLAEGILGLALLLVAVAELGKGTGAGKLAKKVPFI